MSGVKTRLKSCLHCRRHRLRCDRLTRAPRPCTTCWKRGIDCVFTNRSLNELLTGLASPDTHGPEPQDARQPEPSIVKEAPSVPQPELPFQDGPARSFHIYEGADLKAENGTVLTASQVNDCFEYFVSALHPNFPFLSLPLDIKKVLETSPLLFWTIVTVASHRYRTQYRNLQPFVRQLIAGVLRPSGHGLETCQALCLVCLWPFEAEDPNDEPTYLYAGILSHLAMRLGLHRPEFAHEFKDIDHVIGRDHKIYERWRTWCACQFVEHMLASKNGILSGIRPDWPSKMKWCSREIAGRQIVSPIIKHHLQLCAIRDRHLAAISYDGHTLSGLKPAQDRIGHLKLYHAELEEFEAAATPLDTLSAIFLNMSKVTLSGFCLAQDLRSSIRELHMLLRSGLNAAAVILDLVAPLAWETLPVHILRSLLYSGVLSSHIAQCNIELYPTTEPLVILQRATDILRHLAHGQDFPTRAKIVLETELERHSNDHGVRSSTDERPKGVVFQSRMEANMYWDLVESDKAKHNWNQTADDIYWELVLSGPSPVSPHPELQSRAYGNA